MSRPRGAAQQVVIDYVDALNREDWDRLGQILHPDYIEEYPQSGERIVGSANAIALRSNYPRTDEMSIHRERLVGGEDVWALAPNFTAIRLSSEGDTVTSVTRARYPDGFWYVIFMAQVEGAQIRRATLYFAPEFEPPEWRRQWVEPKSTKQARD